MDKKIQENTVNEKRTVKTLRTKIVNSGQGNRWMATFALDEQYSVIELHRLALDEASNNSSLARFQTLYGAEPEHEHGSPLYHEKIHEIWDGHLNDIFDFKTEGSMTDNRLMFKHNHFVLKDNKAYGGSALMKDVNKAEQSLSF